MLRLLMLTLTLLLLSCNNNSEDQNVLEEYSGTWEFFFTNTFYPLNPAPERILTISSNATFSIYKPVEDELIEGNIIVDSNTLFFETDTGLVYKKMFDPNNLPSSVDTLIFVVKFIEAPNVCPGYSQMEGFVRIYD